MKILFVINSLGGGGAQRLISDLAVSLKTRGHNCCFLVMNNGNDKYSTYLTRNGVEVNFLSSNAKTHFSKIKSIKKFILNGCYDVVHANLFPTIYYCAIAKLLANKRFPTLCLTEHSTDNHRRHKSFLRPVEKFIYKKYNRVISISKKTEESLIDWLKTKSNAKFIVVENGVVLESFKNASEFSKIDIDKSLEQTDILLCLVGSFTEQKNHYLAIDVLSRLPQQYKLILVGEGILHDSIIKEIQAKKVESRVYLLGFRNDVASIIKACDIVLVPSKWEGFGLVAVEGMACEKPIVASNVPGLAEVVGNYGLLCNDAQEFVSAILSLGNTSNYNLYVLKSATRCKDFDFYLTACGYEKVFYDSISSKQD